MGCSPQEGGGAWHLLFAISSTAGPLRKPGPTCVHSRKTCGKGRPCGKLPRSPVGPEAAGQLGPTVLTQCAGVTESSRKGELLPKPTSHQGSNRRLLGGHLSPADTRVQLKNLPLGCPNAGAELPQIHAPTDSCPCCLGPQPPGLSRLRNKPPEARVRD